MGHATLSRLILLGQRAAQIPIATINHLALMHNRQLKLLKSLGANRSPGLIRVVDGCPAERLDDCRGQSH